MHVACSSNPFSVTATVGFSENEYLPIDTYAIHFDPIQQNVLTAKILHNETRKSIETTVTFP